MRKTPPAAAAVRAVDLPGLTLRADVRTDSLDPEKRTVELVWTTGARVLRGFFDKYYEELSMDPKHVRMGRLKSGRAPLLDAHNGYELRAVLGVVESARIEKLEGVLNARFATKDEDADRAWNKVEQRILRNVSVGYRVYKYEQVEGGEETIPVYRAVDWEPYEVSIVPMGADEGAQVRADRQVETNRCEFVSRSTATGHEERKTMDDLEKKAAEEAAAKEKDAATKRAAELEAAKKAAAEGERLRAAEIRKVSRALPPERREAFAEKHISGGSTVEQARVEAIDALAVEDEKTPTDGRVRITADESEKFQRGASDWLLVKAGAAEAVIAAAKKRGQVLTVEPGEFRGLTFVDLARMSLERSGRNVRGWDKMRLVGEALTYRGAGAQSTSDFAVLLENTLHKTLLAAYSITPDTWRRFCATGSVSDFRPHPRYRTGSFSRLEALTELGEFKNKPIPDATKEAITADTKGNIVALSRQAIINDDLSAFSRISTMIGRAAALSIEMDVYDTLALNAGLGPLMQDGNTLFHASHANISTGAALSVEALDADRVTMAAQRDRSGNEILDLRPAVLVLAIGLGGQARVINGAEFDVDAIGANLTNLFMVPNRVRGLFRDIVDTPRMSGTRRYLFADPAQAPVLEVAFLDGASEPFLEVRDGWRIDGVEWKVRLDYGVGGVDYVGAVTNAGA